VNSLLGIQKAHSDSILRLSEIIYSIAISKLLEVRTILLKLTLSNMFSKIGVVVIDAVA
jgi:hypothetical protein